MEPALERHIREAIERGELDTPTLAGKPIGDLEVQRPPGWWAEKFVERELARDDDDSDPIAEMIAIWRSRRR
jgi:hypothetical protein